MTTYDRARAYVSKIPGAVSGSGGHAATFEVACALTWGFCLAEHEAWSILQDYNATCSPPWSEAELRHKLNSALGTSSHAKPRGHLIQGQAEAGNGAPHSYHQAPTAPAAPAVSGKAYDLSDATDLPEAIEDGARMLLRSLFRSGESVRIVPAVLNAEDHEIPNGDGTILTREAWLAKLDKVKGNINRIFSSSSKTGIYICINPLRPTGVRDDDVSDLRHLLIEFDSELTPEEQFALYQKSKLPCAAIIFSGGKSVHAWIKVNARDRKEFDERRQIVYSHFEASGLKPDIKNKNPSRLSRFPDCTRFSKRQELLALNTGLPSFAEWLAEIGVEIARDGELPAIRNAQTLVDLDVPTPAELIVGVLHQGLKCIIGGASKSRKSWTLLDLGISVATGQKFWNWETRAGRVLYLNFEIPESFLRKRILAVSNAKQVFDLTNLDVWTLRGHSATLGALLPKLLTAIRVGAYALIIIDPIYKMLGDRDENAAGDINSLCNEIERLCVKTGAAIVFASHYSKGNQSGKQSMDRIGGSGVFTRDADTVITLTSHKEEGAYTVELTLRNLAEHLPFVVRWEYPLMHHVADLNPEDLKQAGGRTSDYSIEDLLVDWPASGYVSAKAWQTAVSDATGGMSKATFDRLKHKLTDTRKGKHRVLKSAINGHWILRNEDEAKPNE